MQEPDTSNSRNQNFQPDIPRAQLPSLRLLPVIYMYVATEAQAISMGVNVMKY